MSLSCSKCDCEHLSAFITLGHCYLNSLFSHNFLISYETTADTQHSQKQSPLLTSQCIGRRTGGSGKFDVLNFLVEHYP